MTTPKHDRSSRDPIPVALADADMDAISGGLDPNDPKVVYVGGSTRYAPGKPGGNTGGLVGIDFRPT